MVELAGLDGMAYYRERDELTRAVMEAVAEEKLKLELKHEEQRAAVWIGVYGRAMKRGQRGRG